MCRVRIVEGEGSPPVVVLTELHENASTSVTNAVELITAELIAKHFPQRFEVVDDDPVVLIEHYPPAAEPGGRPRPGHLRPGGLPELGAPPGVAGRPGAPLAGGAGLAASAGG